MFQSMFQVGKQSQQKYWLLSLLSWLIMVLQALQTSHLLLLVQSERKALNKWAGNYPDAPYIPPRLVQGQETIVDEWEVSLNVMP